VKGKGIVAFNVRTVIDRDSELWQTLWAWPKIELHRHLEGSIRLPTLIEVAREYDITLPAYDVEQLRPHVQVTDEDEATFAVFLSKFSVLRQFYCSLDIVRRITREAIEDAAQDNIRYMELRFTPHALAQQSGLPYADVIGAVTEETQRAEKDFKTRVRLIVSVNRHESVDIATQVLDAVLALNHGVVVAMDLAGQEPDYSAHPFRPVFERAKEAGLHLTIHAGEWKGAENVRDAIEVMGAERIGHGVRAIEDERVVRLITERGITLEVCPISNLHSGVVSQPQHHPLLDLANLAVSTTINTDDPSLSNTTLTDELALAHTGLGMSLGMVKTNILNAARAAFLPEPERIALLSEFRTALGMDDTQPMPPVGLHDSTAG
jgi:adenosine deaminase